jgi:hypothetical protein
VPKAIDRRDWPLRKRFALPAKAWEVDLPFLQNTRRGPLLDFQSFESIRISMVSYMNLYALELSQ